MKDFEKLEFDPRVFRRKSGAPPTLTDNASSIECSAHSALATTRP